MLVPLSSKMVGRELSYDHFWVGLWRADSPRSDLPRSDAPCPHLPLITIRPLNKKTSLCQTLSGLRQALPQFGRPCQTLSTRRYPPWPDPARPCLTLQDPARDRPRTCQTMPDPASHYQTQPASTQNQPRIHPEPLGVPPGIPRGIPGGTPQGDPPEGPPPELLQRIPPGDPPRAPPGIPQETPQGDPPRVLAWGPPEDTWGRHGGGESGMHGRCMIC